MQDQARRSGSTSRSSTSTGIVVTSEFERLWLAVPSGLVSLADAEGCTDSFSDEARAHSSFYAVQSSRAENLRLLGRAFRRVINHK